jgi:hypothetical protein
VVVGELISVVMRAAANELLHHEANRVDQEVEELLTEMALDPLVEGRLEGFMLRFFALLTRRGGIAQRARGVHDADFFACLEPPAGLDGALDLLSDSQPDGDRTPSSRQAGGSPETGACT